MTGRVYPLNASEHAAVDALLPFYANRTLRGEELERVEQHLAACAACRREVDWLKDVFAACAAMAPLPEGERKRAAGTFASGGPAMPGPPARGALAWRSAPAWMRMLLAAQLAAVVFLGTLLSLNAADESSYRTLGADVRPATAGDAIAVLFDPAISEAELRRVVTAVGARIVDGPTTTHAFVLAVPSGQSKAVVQRLRAEPGVRFAEPMGARTAP